MNNGIRHQSQGRTVGIYGGSFNPVHLGHVALAKNIVDSGVVDEVWFMVSPLNPLKKDNNDTMLPAEQRIYLTQLAINGFPQLKVSDIETKLPVPSYTITTLTELKRTYPDFTFKLIVGQDNWKNFDRWVEARKIKDNHDIIVYGRHETTISDESSYEHDNNINESLEAAVIVYEKNGKVKPLKGNQFKLYNISSTQIRTAIKNHDLPFVAKWLNPAVMRYILENAIY